MMVQGTTSDAGKTTLVAGLCRLFADQGYRVAPFKPQNMALNSAVTVDGGEIGRAQALQANAARVAFHTDFNPILLKPGSDTRCQVIVHGKALTSLQADQFFGKASQHYKQLAMKAVLESYGRLTEQYQMVLVEGAGSPAEINLRAHDIANMGFAETADCPVILIADIDKGGVFAHLVGTLALLSESERQRVKGFVINRFRGDISLLQSGLDWLEQHTGKPVLGVLPYLHDLHLDAEDALVEQPAPQSETMPATRKLKVLVLVWPHISNHTDFDPLRLNPCIDFQYYSLKHAAQCYQALGELPKVDLIILPGSKSVRQDLEFMRHQGWDSAILRHLRYGGKVIGICGGYQMLGHRIDDPLGVEGQAGSSQGLRVLDVETTLAASKHLTQVSGTLRLEGAQPAQFNGYEIHCGVTRASQLPVDDSGHLYTHQSKPRQAPIQFKRQAKPDLTHSSDGVVSPDNQVLGTYIHGLFDAPEACAQMLQWAGAKDDQAVDIGANREAQLQRLATTLAHSLDMEKLNQILNRSTTDEKRSCNDDR